MEGLSQIQEETLSRESTCKFPLIQRRTDQKEEEPDEPEEEEELCGSSSDPASMSQCEQQEALQGDRSLLEELGDMEAELRLEGERQREIEFLRRQDNRTRWTSLCFLSLEQRVNKPWVSSYFRKFPMHIYCLPIQRARR